VVTTISGFQGVDLKATAKSLKQALACGGTVKNNTVELQGDHSKTAKAVLVRLGFPEESIEKQFLNHYLYYLAKVPLFKNTSRR